MKEKAPNLPRFEAVLCSWLLFGFIWSSASLPN